MRIKNRILAVMLAAMLAAAFVPALAPIGAAAPGDAISFPDPAFEAAVRETIGKPTGAITASDVAGVTYLNVSERNIADLTGIEHFTSLEVLYCDYNRLTELDVSKNTALVTLHSSYNQLESLDVSKNLELEGLSCGYNWLDELDVSNNTKLVDLNCSSNWLTELDVSKNDKLVSLWCMNNNLANLDITKNPELANLNISRNQLTTLDVTQKPGLTVLEIFGNQLNVLDVSKNPELLYLSCSGNELTSLDISKNGKLKILYCEGNYFSSKADIIGLDESILSEFDYDPQRGSVPGIDSASIWAKAHITEAYEKGFIPYDVQHSYKNVITRGEFCRMAMQWLEVTLGMYTDMIVAESGIPERAGHSFTDTDDASILAAYRLGITSGTAEPTDGQPGVFTPDGAFTREQAATMIMNVCRVAGMNVSNTAPADFGDIGEASGWAVDAINFVRNSGIMSGTGTAESPKFSPKGTYTREQSIVTFNCIER